MSAGNRVTVSKQFVADFDKVCERYNLTEAEKREAREAARRDIEAAQETFAVIAAEIRKE